MLALNQHRQLSAVLSLERAEDLSSRMLYPPWSDMLCSHLKCASITINFLFTYTYSLSLLFLLESAFNLMSNSFQKPFLINLRLHSMHVIYRGVKSFQTP